VARLTKEEREEVINVAEGAALEASDRIPYPVRFKQREKEGQERILEDLRRVWVLGRASRKLRGLDPGQTWGEFKKQRLAE